MQTKICSKCGIEKDYLEFNRDKNAKDGYRCWCKQCQKQYMHSYIIQNKERRKEYLLKNKEIFNAKSREYYQQHKEEINKKHKIYAKQYRKDNKDIIKLKKQLYRLEHKQERNEQEKLKRKENKIYKLKIQIRNMIYISFKRKYKTKNEKTEKILGCSILDFTNYLLQTYKSNYGYEWDGIEKVHIDHKTPLALAKTEADVIRLCHYTNLQLLKEKDNLEKSNKKDWVIMC